MWPVIQIAETHIGKLHPVSKANLHNSIFKMDTLMDDKFTALKKHMKGRCCQSEDNCIYELNQKIFSNGAFSDARN